MNRLATELLDARARRSPKKTAVIDEHMQITFSELQERARRIGSALIAHGLDGKPVVVVLEKGIDALAAQLGVLYAGGCYVPIDPVAAPARLAPVCRTLESPVIITDAATQALLAEPFTAAPAGVILDVRELAAGALDPGALRDAAAHTLDTDPAYILFTSGSTGMPKGVVVSHRAIVEFIESFTELFGIDETDVIGNQAPFDFDVSVKDIYSALAVGATLVILPRRLFSAPAELIDALNAHRVTTLTWAVAALCLLTRLHALDYASLPHVRRVLFSGEVMPTRHLATWLERLPHAEFVNLYGPTEVTCNCLYHRIDRARDYTAGIPLGTPFPNHEVLLLDDKSAPVTQAGTVGELYVRSPQLALGYIGDSVRTAEAFVQNPLQHRWPETVYRTGDLAELSAAGELFFCGRRDNQIKYQGHRVELEEIDLAFERLPGVTRCRCAFDAARERIYAFFEGEGQATDVAAAAQAALPAHLMPSACIPVSNMPLSKNGKVDRQALLELHAPRRRRKHNRSGA